MRPLLVTLLAERLSQQRALPVRQAAWYCKPPASFADAMALVRYYLWAQAHFYTSPGTPDLVEIPRALLQRVTDTRCYAA